MKIRLPRKELNLGMCRLLSVINNPNYRLCRL